MYEEREPTKSLIASWRIPHTAVAELANVFRSEVSRYVRNQKVSDKDRIRIEQTVREIADYIFVYWEYNRVPPDLKDTAQLREQVRALKDARAEHEKTQQQLEHYQVEIREGLRAMAEGR
jgi:hypothetical protein